MSNDRQVNGIEPKGQIFFMRVYDVIIIGAGASGLMCAAETGKRSRRVAVLDHQPSAGKKIRISGGGYCNFSNRVIRPEHYVSTNVSFVKSALARYTPEDFLQWLKKRRISFYEKKNGQLFCKMKASMLADALKQEAVDTGVIFYMNHAINEISGTGPFIVKTNKENFQSDSLVIATGGLSYPQTGATDFGYRVARQYGLNVIEPRPALVPMKWNENDRKRFGCLVGISIPIRISAGDQTIEESLLFTHYGISGPGVLQASLYWRPGTELRIDLLPGLELKELILCNKTGNRKLGNILGEYLPKRFIAQWLEEPLRELLVSQISNQLVSKISGMLHRWSIQPAGTEGYAVAEVTAGGVDTRELSSKTMETKKVPRLYFTGEVMDVTGHLGGYNLHWAWASGAAAGRAV